jgi:transcription-repair coupling factor (superfamily II helicase)
VKSQIGTLLVPRPQPAAGPQAIGGRPIAGVALLEWARTVIDSVIDPDRAAGTSTNRETP